MFKANILLALAGTLVVMVAPQLTQAAPAHKAAAPTQATTVVLYEGGVDEKSGGRFVDLINDNIDKVIGLKIVVDATPSEKGHLSIFTGRPLNISWSGGDVDEEVLINGDIGTTNGGYLVDGFYLVKSGGQHAAGALSTGLIPVDEAAIRLNPNVKIVEKGF